MKQIEVRAKTIREHLEGAKVVQPGFVQAIDEHWSRRAIEADGLATRSLLQRSVDSRIR